MGLTIRQRVRRRRHAWLVAASVAIVTTIILTSLPATSRWARDMGAFLWLMTATYVCFMSEMHWDGWLDGYVAGRRAAIPKDTPPTGVPCQVWGRRLTRRARLADWWTNGHTRHVCTLNRPFTQRHAGDHVCACDVTYPHLTTDND